MKQKHLMHKENFAKKMDIRILRRLAGGATDAAETFISKLKIDLQAEQPVFL